MSTMLALYSMLAKVMVRQDAMLSALEKKGILTEQELNAAIPPDEDMKRLLDGLHAKFIAQIKTFEENDTRNRK